MINTLEADSILLEYGLRKILSDVYIKCETKKITGLLGRNGEGKTSLMNIIYGSLKPENQFVQINKKPISQPFRYPESVMYLPPVYLFT